MTSDKQLQANRFNAQKGGVKTKAGKAISRYNAIKHGLLSQQVAIADENREDLESLADKLYSQLLPQSKLEVVLVDRITANVWRLRRVMRIEREMMENDRGIDFDGNQESLGKAMSYDFANYDSYGKLIRYEASIERGIYKALHELQRLQSARNGNEVPLPSAVDIDVSMDTPNGFVS